MAGKIATIFENDPLYALLCVLEIRKTYEFLCSTEKKILIYYRKFLAAKSENIRSVPKIVIYATSEKSRAFLSELNKFTSLKKLFSTCCHTVFFIITCKKVFLRLAFEINHLKSKFYFEAKT